jgi:zinc transporter 9
MYALITLAIALFGGLLPVLSKVKDNPERLKTLTGIAAGIIIASAMLVVIPEGYDLATAEGHDSELDGWMLGGAILGGFVLMLLLEGSGIGHAVHEEHHDHDDEHGHDHVHHSNNGWMMVLGLTLHSATDGLAIGAAAATGSVTITATVAIAVLIHKAPAAFSLGVFSMHEREKRNESIIDVVVFSLATPIMMMIAFYTLSDLEIQTIGLAMLFSAGTFLYVATVDTLPDIHNPETGRKAMLFVLLGIALFSVLLLGADAAGLIEHAH